ncbi:tetraacyldisaccharide 4'-kinase [Candidatus Pelagibacter sp.]|nr:tetraacyldisaccharide 4'-kinase [Candidatus Pelagibacter sp.]
MIFNKPKFWDLKKPNLMSYLLLPFTLVVELNNFIQNLKTSKKNKIIKSVCVGNIYLGGTGKTPTALEIYKILKDLSFKVAIGKKFYLSQKDERIILKNNSNFISSNTRRKILEKAIKNKYQVIIFDDGLQNKSIFYDLKIVCFDSQNWIGNGLIIPSGPLRENISSLKNYDCVIFKDNYQKNSRVINTIKKINKKIKIFYSEVKISNLKKINKNKKYLIFSGIGNFGSFKNTLLKRKINIKEEIIFPDHYNFKEQDIINVKKRAKKIGAKILTTEKDFVKISQKQRKGINLIKINLKIKNKKSFINFLKSKIYE